MKKLLLLTIMSAAALLSGCISDAKADSGHTNFVTSLTTTDITTNAIFRLGVLDPAIPISNACVRVEVRSLAYNAAASASYGRIMTVKCVGGGCMQIGPLATLGLVEADAQFETRVYVDSNSYIAVDVAGNNGRTVSWTVWVDVYWTN
jgi:hypothetical protein